MPVLARAVFLDRDGVINRSDVVDGKPYAPRSLDRFRLLPHAADSIRLLKEAGFLVIVVTNQPDIGNGVVEAAVVEAMHDKLRRLCPVDDILCCAHKQTEGCECRKPKPGMLLDAAKRWGIALQQSYMVGDRAGDVIAGLAAQCYTILVDRNYKDRHDSKPNARARSLADATRHILTRETFS